MNGMDTLAFFEKQVKEAIQKSETPYLGLADELLSSDAQAFVEKALVKSGGQLRNFEKGLRLSPALFVGYLSSSLRHHLGADTSAVYGCINIAMGKPADTNQTNEERTGLWMAFRSACQKLGLPLSSRHFGPNYMVDAYLEQAGIPEASMPELIKRMDIYAKKYGLPELDDVAAEQAWYSSFKKTLKPPFRKRSIRALENDVTDYYLHKFIDERKELLSVNQYHIAQSPLLAFIEDDLKLVIPAGASAQKWEIDMDGNIDILAVQQTDYQYLIDDLSTQNIVLISNSLKYEFQLWNSSKDNQIALFKAENGHYVSSHSLTDEGVALSPGKYQILSRFKYSSIEIELNDYLQEGFYVGDFEIKPSSNISIKRGPVTFNILAHSEPTILIQGRQVTPHTGKSFYCSTGMKFVTCVPKEWISDNEQYELELISNVDESNTILALNTDESEHSSCFDYKAIGWKPGLKRILIKLRKVGQKRALSRVSTLVWCGLDSISNGFDLTFAELPIDDSLDIEKSLNVRIDLKSKKLVAVDRDLPFVDLHFKFLGKSNQKLRFALHGTFIYISDLKDGFREEKLLDIGSTLAVTYNDTRRIRIYSSENPTLEIGTHTLHNNFEKRHWYKTSLASLIDKVDRSNNELVARFGSQTQTLLRLVSPHYIANWNIQEKSQTIDLSFETPTGISEIEIIATNLLNLSKQYIYANSIDGKPCYNRGAISAILVHHDSDSLAQIVTIDVSEALDGPWLLEFTGSVEGKWGRFANKRNDHFTVGFTTTQGYLTNLNGEYFSKLKEFGVEQSVRLLSLLTTKLNKCYEIQSWNSISWIKGIWTFILNNPEFQESEVRKNIVPLSIYQATEEDSPSWVPQVNLSAYFTDIYTKPFDEYRKLDAQNSTRLKSLKLAGEINQSLLNAIKTEKLSVAVAVFFSNKSEYSDPTSQTEPVDFQYQKFLAVLPYLFSDKDFTKLQNGDIRPAFGDLLGGIHFAYSQLNFVEYEKLAQGGNDFIRPQFNTLLIKVAREIEGETPILLPDHYFGDDHYLKELLEAACKFSSYLARAYRSSRWEGESLIRVFESIEAHVEYNADLKSLLSYFFGVCGDLFHFYLLFWEVYFVSRSNNYKGSLTSV